MKFKEDVNIWYARELKALTREPSTATTINLLTSMLIKFIDSLQNNFLDELKKGKQFSGASEMYVAELVSRTYVEAIKEYLNS